MTKQPSLYAFPDNPTLQQNLYRYILHAQSDAFARHHKFKVAISGGSVPKLLAAPDLLSSREIQWGKWEIFLADERAVPLTHADSNYALLRAEFLSKIPKSGPRPTVHPIDPEKLGDTQDLADAYEKALIGSFAAKDSVKLPMFDLLLLGCGPDGHTCSLFPGHGLLREEVAWVAAIEDSPKPPPRRITLTLPVITHALKIAFVATGAGKQEVMRRIFDTHPDTEGGEVLPCALVNLGAGDKVSWFCDLAAVEGVSFPKKSSL
ncbi:nagb/rpia/CoA transferase-like protein [Choiromyces venosus 120613-1]|uniref:6-phosphogluconolactonase n=1 Tax=Choiromyces venosus 120613-1 TaxID=1336337 RepID=A0A3N4K6T7_9PEZI|nr:nagb/rpia/CoA transferase-like protein [Choiromyces venosus 120613-1]